jgi:hypothetical protein
VVGSFGAQTGNSPGLTATILSALIDTMGSFKEGARDC